MKLTVGKSLTTVAAGMAAFSLVVSATVLTSAPAVLSPEGSSGLGRAVETTKKTIQEAFGKLPLAFEANRGQTDRRVDFMARGPGYTTFLTAGEAVFKLQAAAGSEAPALRMQLLGSNSSARPSSTGRLEGRVNYFRGDPSQWVRNVPTFQKVTYRGVYSGIDVAYYGNQRRLEYDFIVAPGADPSQIKMHFAGADRLSLGKKGELKIAAGEAELTQPKPYIYQGNAKSRRAVGGEYILTGRNEVGFKLGPYDRSKTLVIDPILSYSSYLSDTPDSGLPRASGADVGFGIAVDRHGNAYVAGSTFSPHFPVAVEGNGCSEEQPYFCNNDDTINSKNEITGSLGDAFVTKVNPSGTALVYSTYLGGTRNDQAWDIAVDENGWAFVAGSTESTDFPTTKNAYAGKCANNCNASDSFLVKLNAGGNNLLYSTYLGGSDHDQDVSSTSLPGHMDLALYGATAFIASTTGSQDFPTTPNAADNTCGLAAGCLTAGDAYLSLIDTSMSGADSLIYSTYIGGDGFDEAKGVAVDTHGNAYVAGTTAAVAASPSEPAVNNFPTHNAFQPVYSGGFSDAFVTKFPTGSLFGQVVDEEDIAVEAQLSPKPKVDVRIGPAYSTFLGGGATDQAWDVAVVPHVNKKGKVNGGHAVVVGHSDSGDDPGTPHVDTLIPFPTTPDAYDKTFNGRASKPDGSATFLSGDATVTRLSEDGKKLEFSTFLGGGDHDVAAGVATDAAGNIYLTGYTTCETPVEHSTATGVGLGPFASARLSVTFPPPPTAEVPIPPPGPNNRTKTSTTEYTVRVTTQAPGTEVTLQAVPDARSGPEEAIFPLQETPSNTIKVVTDAFDADGRPIGETTVKPRAKEPENLKGVVRIEASTPERKPSQSEPTGSEGDVARAVASWGYPYPECAGTFPIAGDSVPQPKMDGAYILTELHNSPTDVFEAKLDAAGKTLLHSSYLGGNDFDRGFAVAVRDRDSLGNPIPAEIYLTGRTASKVGTGAGFPTTPGAFQATKPSGKGNRDAFVAKIVE